MPVLIGAASFDESGRQGVAFVLDLTERKRAEAEVRKSEQRYREMQMALAHANRVTTMGNSRPRSAIKSSSRSPRMPPTRRRVCAG